MEESAYARFVNGLSATSFGSWLVKHVASKIDPLRAMNSGPEAPL